jgi:hypothetical protein
LGTSKTVSVTTAIAANVDGDRVGVYIEPEVRAVVNGRTVLSKDGVLKLPKGGSVERRGNDFFVQWRDTTGLRVEAGGVTERIASDSGGTRKFLWTYLYQARINNKNVTTPLVACVADVVVK